MIGAVLNKEMGMMGNQTRIISTLVNKEVMNFPPSTTSKGERN